MAAGDAAMMQLAQTFANLAQNTVVGTNALNKLNKVTGDLINRFVFLGKEESKLSKAISAMSASFVGITAKLSSVPLDVFGTLTGSFQSIIDVASKFVSALNPAVVEQLQLAFDDLFAVVGRLFMPIMAAVVPIVRTFADALVPVVQSLMPTFKLLADAIISVAAPMIVIFSGLIQTLAPQFQLLAGWFQSLAAVIGQGLFQYINALVPLFAGLMDAVGILMPAVTDLVGAMFALAVPLMQIIVPLLVPALKVLAIVVGKVVEALSWLIGKATEGLKMIAPAQGGPNLKIPPIQAGASRGAAAKGAQFMGFSEFGSQLMAASFGSSVNTPEFKTAENTAKIAEGIDTLVKQGQNQAPAVQINQAGRGKF